MEIKIVLLLSIVFDDNFYFTEHIPISMSFSGVEVHQFYRVQVWDFTNKDIPTISDRNIF